MVNTNLLVLCPTNEHIDSNINEYYSNKFIGINPRFYGLNGFPHWKLLYGIHYDNIKPHVLEEETSTHDMINNNAVVKWHELYEEILDAHHNYFSLNILKGVNELHLLFHSVIGLQKRQISRIHKHMSINEPLIDKKILINIFKHDIHDDQIEYYHINKDMEYAPKLMPMWDDIKIGDWIEPVRRLENYYGTDSFYSKILEKYEINGESKFNQHEKDLMMLEYIKCRENMFVVTLWPILLNAIDLDVILNILKKYGSICYTKKIRISKKGLYNLMHWFYNDFTIDQRLLIAKLKNRHSKDMNDVAFVFLDNTNNSRLSGAQSEDKTNIRSELRTIIKEKKVDAKTKYLIHINDNFYQTVYYSQIVLNDNTIKMLEKQNINAITNQSMCISNMKLQTFKKWATLNLSLLEIGRLILSKDIILYLLGKQKLEIIKGTYISVNNDSSQSEIELAELININLYNPKTKFFFTDIKIKNNEIITNPHNYYYYNGLKCEL